MMVMMMRKPLRHRHSPIFLILLPARRAKKKKKMTSTGSFSPVPGELALVSQIFAQADPKKLGIITGDVAVNIFAGANLSPLVLGEIWSIADEDNKGWLAKRGVAIAVRLMGWAQAGEKITPALVRKRRFFFFSYSL
jgi:hypothetical protein